MNSFPGYTSLTSKSMCLSCPLDIRFRVWPGIFGLHELSTLAVLAAGKAAPRTRHRGRTWSLQELNHTDSLSSTTAGMMDLYNRAIDIASNPKHTRWLSPLLLVADACLCVLIIWKIPCKLPFQADPIFPTSLRINNPSI